MQRVGVRHLAGPWGPPASEPCRVGAPGWGGGGEGHLAPIPGVWGEVDLPKGALGGLSPHTSSGAGFQVRRGKQDPDPPSRHSTSGFPSQNPSLFLLVPRTAAGARSRPGVELHARTREGVGFVSQAPHPSPVPLREPARPSRRLLSLTVRVMRAPGGCHGAGAAAAGAGWGAWGAAAGAPAHASASGVLPR